MSELKIHERELVSLGAAIASNCIPCIEYHIPEARKAGLRENQIEEAIKIADKVRQVPARAVLETALAKINKGKSIVTETTDGGCGCGEPRTCNETR